MDDNPWLEEDDIYGRGPEITASAAPEDGVYTLAAHDYSGSVYDSPNAAVVEVYVNGVLADTFSEPITDEDCVWTIATAQVQGNTVHLTEAGDMDCP